MSLDLACVCVFCGSSPGADGAFADAAELLGRELGRRGIRLVYGGGRVGLMGVLADSALRAGAEVHGVITTALRDKEVAHLGLTSLRVVATMHERKAAMAADAPDDWRTSAPTQLNAALAAEAADRPCPSLW